MNVASDWRTDETANQSDSAILQLLTCHSLFHSDFKFIPLLQRLNVSSLDSPQLAALWLNLISGIGPRMQQQLLETFGSPEDILTASRAELLSVKGIGNKLADSIREKQDISLAEEEYKRCEENNVKLIFRESDMYPQPLAEIYDAPSVLYCKGGLLPQDEMAVSIVGSRNCTPYGKQQAESLSSALAHAGLTIISGMARGIDAAAHLGAIKVKGRTIGVAATGMYTVYPPEHQQLAEQIAANGAVLTECQFHQAPVPGLFPQRNRIISGLSQGVVVIEAHPRSGALYTARHALEQGRDVFALPGRVDSQASEGCHELIREGATLIRHADDVIESLGPLANPIKVKADEEFHSARELTLNEQERSILNLITTQPRHTDDILEEMPLESSRVLSTLTILEMKRFIQRLPGGYFIRANG